jgi:hypothetical protein
LSKNDGATGAVVAEVIVAAELNGTGPDTLDWENRFNRGRPTRPLIAEKKCVMSAITLAEAACRPLRSGVGPLR